jgi:hypothetical protein
VIEELIDLMSPHIAVSRRAIGELRFILDAVMKVGRTVLIFGPNDHDLIAFFHRAGVQTIPGGTAPLIAKRFPFSQVFTRTLALFGRAEEDHLRTMIYTQIAKFRRSVVVIGSRGIEDTRYKSMFKWWQSFGQIERAPATAPSVGDVQTLVFCIPAGGGKSTLSTRIGFDIDHIRSPSTEPRLKLLRRARNWTEHNKLWWSVIHDYDYGDNRVLFMHSPSDADHLPDEMKPIHTIVLIPAEDLHEQSILVRDVEGRALARENRASLEAYPHIPYSSFDQLNTIVNFSLHQLKGARWHIIPDRRDVLWVVDDPPVQVHELAYHELKLMDWEAMPYGVWTNGSRRVYTCPKDRVDLVTSRFDSMIIHRSDLFMNMVRFVEGLGPERMILAREWSVLDPDSIIKSAIIGTGMRGIVSKYVNLRKDARLIEMDNITLATSIKNARMMQPAYDPRAIALGSRPDKEQFLDFSSFDANYHGKWTCLVGLFAPSNTENQQPEELIPELLTKGVDFALMYPDGNAMLENPRIRGPIVKLWSDELSRDEIIQYAEPRITSSTPWMYDTYQCLGDSIIGRIPFRPGLRIWNGTKWVRGSFAGKPTPYMITKRGRVWYHDYMFYRSRIPDAFVYTMHEVAMYTNMQPVQDEFLSSWVLVTSFSLSNQKSMFQTLENHQTNVIRTMATEYRMSRLLDKDYTELMRRLTLKMLYPDALLFAGSRIHGAIRRKKKDGSKRLELVSVSGHAISSIDAICNYSTCTRRWLTQIESNVRLFIHSQVGGDKELAAQFREAHRRGELVFDSSRHERGLWHSWEDMYVACATIIVRAAPSRSRIPLVVVHILRLLFKYKDTVWRHSESFLARGYDSARPVSLMQFVNSLRLQLTRP